LQEVQREEEWRLRLLRRRGGGRGWPSRRGGPVHPVRSARRRRRAQQLLPPPPRRRRYRRRRRPPAAGVCLVLGWGGGVAAAWPGAPRCCAATLAAATPPPALPRRPSSRGGRHLPRPTASRQCHGACCASCHPRSASWCVPPPRITSSPGTLGPCLGGCGGSVVAATSTRVLPCSHDMTRCSCVHPWALADGQVRLYVRGGVHVGVLAGAGLCVPHAALGHRLRCAAAAPSHRSQSSPVSPPQ
jgi:hypothetical protein